MSLEKIEIPKMLKSVGHEAFMHCQRLEEVNFHEKLEVIGLRAFQTCVRLQSITFKNGNISIGHTFDDCSYKLKRDDFNSPFYNTSERLLIKSTLNSNIEKHTKYADITFEVIN